MANSTARTIEFSGGNLPGNPHSHGANEFSKAGETLALAHEQRREPGPRRLDQQLERGLARATADEHDAGVERRDDVVDPHAEAVTDVCRGMIFTATFAPICRPSSPSA